MTLHFTLLGVYWLGVSLFGVCLNLCIFYLALTTLKNARSVQEWVGQAISRAARAWLREVYHLCNLALGLFGLLLPPAPPSTSSLGGWAVLVLFVGQHALVIEGAVDLFFWLRELRRPFARLQGES